jgi:PBP1b-binding outer membrane lipoprotein LpoB
MNKQNKTKLQFILGGILFVTFAVAGCNGGETEKEATKDTTATEIKTTVPDVPVKDTMDTGDKAPVVETKPK